MSADAVILAYLAAQNRPYSANDIVANLKGAVTKPVAARALATMAESSTILAKTYGKQIVYSAIPMDAVEAKEAKRVDAEVGAAMAEVEGLKEAVKQRVAVLQQLGDTLSDEDLAARLAALCKRNDESQARLDRSTSASAPVVTCDEKLAIDKAHASAKKERDGRKRKFMDAMGMLEEGLNKKRAVIMGELGLEMP